MADSLEERLNGGALPLKEIARIFQTIAPTLDAAHAQKIVHRDLKPSNILFDKHSSPYVANFGMAQLAAASNKRNKGTGLVGTPAYMSPEQARGQANLDGRSDIYSLGVILFEMLTGQPPYRSDTALGMALRHVNDPIPTLVNCQPNVPPGAQAIINRAMAKTS